MTQSVLDPVETIRTEIQTWDSPFVELDCFGTDNAAQIAEFVTEFCRAHLGSGIRGYYFYRASIGSTHGVRLEDGREVMIKVRPPAETNPDLSFDCESLGAICAVMTWLVDRHYPCPNLLLGENGRIVTTYDWDSLAFRPETELVGLSAHGFTADWALEGVRRIPTANDIRTYVTDYEEARGRPFSKRERRSLFAHCVYFIAYGARCTHSLEPDKTDWEEDTWLYLLRTEGDLLLRDSMA